MADVNQTEMASKKTNVSKHESEIEKLRNENKWDKLKDYASNLFKNKDSKYGKSQCKAGFLFHFVMEKILN